MNTNRLLPLAEVGIDHEVFTVKGYDPIAIAKTIHNANQARRIHNPRVGEFVRGSTVMEVENPSYHNEPTPIHTLYVGSIMRYWTNSTEVPLGLPEYVYQTLGYEPQYIEDMLNAQTEDPDLQEELVIKWELFSRIYNFIKTLPLDDLEKNTAVLWGYFHDLGKIFRPYLKETEVIDGDIVIRKDEEGGTIKSENRLNEFTTEFTPPEEEEHEYLEQHTLKFLKLFFETGMLSGELYNYIKILHEEYSKVSFLIKGESNMTLPESFSDLQKFALVALAADELGKGVIFKDRSGHKRRMGKLNHLKSLLETYL